MLLRIAIPRMNAGRVLEILKELKAGPAVLRSKLALKEGPDWSSGVFRTAGIAFLTRISGVAVASC